MGYPLLEHGMHVYMYFGPYVPSTAFISLAKFSTMYMYKCASHYPKMKVQHYIHHGQQCVGNLRLYSQIAYTFLNPMSVAWSRFIIIPKHQKI